jgi:hypothetical protein
MPSRRILLMISVLACLATAILVAPSYGQIPSNEPNLTPEQKESFLLNAKVVASHELGTGKTHPWRLTLSDGSLTHDAAFQSVDIRKQMEKFASGRSELNFRDSYHYNIAGYELAKLLGLDDMVPATVERRWNGQSGALSWWVPWKWMESTRRQENLRAPDMEAWNRQMYKARVFDQLIYDTDINLTNVLITEDWKVWRIDFTRAFRLYNDLESPNDLVQCDRQLLERLRKLDFDELLTRTKPHLTKSEVKAVMARRDKIVARFDKLVAQKGEGAVLY